MPNKDKNNKIQHETKRCPECFTELPLYARVCISCKRKVGKVDKHGKAKRPFDWLSYFVCFLSWLVLILYVWWAFFR